MPMKAAALKIKFMNDDLFLRRFKELSAHLLPILNNSMKETLLEAEKRLADLHPHSKASKPGQGKSLTKEQILNKWLNKY